ncbi:3'-5' exonuclease [Chloropicon primus]|nr:3'-5' exonuclease [Chloropicon primus]
MEHHHYYSFLGVTCLLQIYVPGKQIAYLVDAISLKSEEVKEYLGPVLENAEVLKVIHGAGNDVLWLQRDFKVHLVNIFDTEQVAKILQKEKSSLGSLLVIYFGVTKETKYQMADWRQRPLDPGMVEYALMDIYFLPSLKLILARELIETSLRVACKPSKYVLAYTSSQKVALRTYKHKRRKPEKLAMSILRKGKKRNWIDEGVSVDLRLWKRLAKWRNDVAEAIDVSLHALMPDYVLCQVALRASSSLTEKSLLEFLFPYMDKIIFKEKIQPHLASLLRALLCDNTVVSEQGRGDKAHGKKTREMKRQQYVERFRRKTPAYDSCKILSKTGKPLSYCDRKKLQWYLKEKLATLVESDGEGYPSIIRLNFQHNSTDQQKRSPGVYPKRKGNYCVGCGEPKNYLRWHVIPTIYRHNFPIGLKSHRSDDIVVLCVHCHEVASAAADRLKSEIAKELSIPLLAVDSSNGPTWKVWTRAHKAAMVLGVQGDRIPTKREAELKQDVGNAFEGISAAEVNMAHVVAILSSSKSSKAKQVVDRLLESVKNGGGEANGAGPKSSQKMSVRRPDAATPGKKRSGQYVHGAKVVGHLVEHGGEQALLDLIVRFKKRFVESLSPKHLPEGWSLSTT